MPETYDVVVVGGGAGGVAAAVGAAQSGARVCLIEQYGFLGGAATNSSVLAFCGFFDQQQQQVVDGVGGSILRRLRDRGVYAEKVMGWTGNRIVLLDQESTKRACDEEVAEAGVRVLLHSRVISVEEESEGVRSVVINHRGGNIVVSAQTFIDASGDGVLIGSVAGGAQDIPVEDRQTNTLACRFGGVAADADLSRAGMEAAVAAYNESAAVKLVRDYGIAVRLPVTGTVMALLVDEHFDTLNVDELSHAESHGREQAWQYLEALRGHLAGWSEARLEATGPQIGIRESRRLIGREMLRGDDVIAARKRPEDSIGRCGWPIEDHAGPGITNYISIDQGHWYDIPYGAVCSAAVDNLWAVGRLTSADDPAFASVRVMGAAFATGHAAGIAAAQYAAGRRHDLAEIQTELGRQGATLTRRALA